MSPKLKRLLIGVSVIALTGGIYLFIHRGEQSTDDATIEAHVVTLSPKVSGYVKTLHISDNQQVKAGEVLLEIDPADYLISRDRAQAAVTAAHAAADAAAQNVTTTNISAPSNLLAAKAQVAAALANWKKAQSDLNRMQKMGDEARSRERLEAAIAAEKTTHSNYDDAKARLRTAESAPATIAGAQANYEELQARVKQAEAELAQAEKNLTDTKVIAPIDGRITNRGVEQGDYVQSGEQLGALVGNDFWVVANFKETQLKHMQRGQKVDVEIDAFPNHPLEGQIDSIQSGTGARFSAFPPENATGNFVKIVQRVPVKITFTKAPDANLALGPGMSVEPIVYTR